MAGLAGDVAGGTGDLAGVVAGQAGVPRYDCGTWISTSEDDHHLLQKFSLALVEVIDIHVEIIVT